jgi:hypothetical protein
VRPLDGLLQSYLDLETHFDPAAASAAGLVSADARLGAFDPQSMREHLAAFRAIAVAIEDLELDDLEDEIDRTALLDQVRTRALRFEQERPHQRDPGFWLSHARKAIASLLERTTLEPVMPAAMARIGELPKFFDAARSSIRRPPVLLVDTALADLGPLGELLVRAAGELGPHIPAGPERLNQGVKTALESLARFGTALRDEIEPEVVWDRAAFGLERFERRLNEAYAIRSSVAELARWAERMLDPPPPPPPPPPERSPAPAAPDLVGTQELAVTQAASAVRRSIRSPVAVEGWRLYASGIGREDDPAWQSRLRIATARLAADVGLHTRGTRPADAIDFLQRRGGMPAEAAAREVRAIVAEPTSGVAAAAGYREYQRLRQAHAAGHGEDLDAFHAGLLRYGALPPGLAAWGMRIDA